MSTIPFSITVLFLGITLLLALFFPLLSARAAKNAGCSAKRRRTIPLFTGGAIVLWLVLTGILAGAGFFNDFLSLPPHFAVAILPPLLVILLASLRPVRAFIRKAPVSWLIYIQAFRVLVEWMLYQLHGIGVVPEQMTFEGLNFDIITGLTALPVGWLASRGGRGAVKVAQIWNAVGLALVVTVMVVSILSAPTPFRLFTDGPANTFIAHFPFIWLPAFAVPSALLLHLWSLGQLRGKEVQAGGRGL